MKKSIFSLLVAATILVACDNSEDTTEVNIQDYLNAAAEFRTAGQYQSALIEVRNAVQAAPDSVAAFSEMAAIMVEIGQQRQAITSLESLPSLDTKASLLLARAYLEVGKLRSARDTLDSEALAGETESSEFKILKSKVSLAERDIDTASQLLNEVIAVDPTNQNALLGLINVATIESDIATARERIDELLALNPENAEALLILSRLEQRAGDLEQEENYLMQAISAMQTTDIITPLRYSILVGLRDNLTKQGKSSEALLYAGLLAESLPNADENQQQMQEAVELLESGEFTAAREVLEQLLETAPGSQPAITMLAVIDFLEGNEEAASIKFEDVIDPETSSPVALQLFAVTELRLNNADKVIETLEKDIDSNNDSKLNALYAVALASNGRLEESEDYFKRSIKWEPETGRLHLPLARLYNQQNNPEAALSELRSAFEKSPEEALVQRSLIAQLLSMGEEDSAEAVVFDITQQFAEQQQSWLLAASYYLQAGDLDKGDAALASALKLGPSLIAEHQRARILLQQGKHTKAKANYLALIENNSEDGDAYKGFITAYELSGEVENAISELRTMHNASKSNTLALVLSEYYGRNGDLLQAQRWLDNFEGEATPQSIGIAESLIISTARSSLADGDSEAGMKALLAGLEEFPESSRILASLVTLEINNDSLESAQSFLDQLSSISTEPIVPLLNGDLESAKGNFLAAKTAYMDAWQLAPNDQIGFKIFSVMQSGKRTPEEISEFLTTWVSTLPTSAVAGVTQAGFLYSVGDLEKSQNVYENLIEQNANNAIAHNNLAWIYGEAKIDKAVASAKAAFDLAGNRPEIIDTYGWFLFKSGEVEQAEKLLAEAAKLAPDNQEIAEHLAEVRAAL